MEERREPGLTDTLLGLYECALAPDKYPDCAHVIEDWLAEEPDPGEIRALETHSSAIWDRLVDLFPPESDPPVGDLRLEVEFGRDPAGRLDAFLDEVQAEDARRLRDLVAEAPAEGGRDLLIRASHGGEVALCLARREGGRLRIFALRNDLEAEVEAMIASQFNISHAEMAVLRGLVMGRTLKAIAAAGGKSPETVRSQAKSIAAKLGFSRQIEISAAMSSIARVARTGGPRPHATGLHRIDLPDGRGMVFDDRGAPDGDPVLFVHDFSSSCRWPGGAVAQIAAAGLRLIAPARAGFGHSDVNPLTQRALFEAHVADYRHLIETLGIEGCRILAFGTGFGIAHGLARADPARAGRLVGVNAYPPILTRRDALRFPPGMYRAGALAAIYAPRTCALISKYATRRAAAARSIRELDAMTGARGPYTEIEDRFFEEHVRPNVDDLRIGRAEGVWRDCTCLTIDWAGEAAADRPVDAVLLQNADFPSQPVEPARALARQLGIPFAVLERPYRHYVVEFRDVIAHLTGQVAPSAT